MFGSLENARFNTSILQNDKRERERERERVNNYQEKRRKVGGAARFSFLICRYKIEMLMSHESLLF